MSALDIIAKQQASWSATADKLKQTVDRARWAAFGLSISGALLGAIASQYQGDVTVRRVLVGVGVLALAISTFMISRLASQAQINAWARARAASEALKREGFRRAAQASPYDNPATADALLEGERKTVEDNVDDLAAERIEPTRASRVPSGTIEPDKYKTDRVQDQIGFYARNAVKYHRLAGSMRRIEIWLALGATVITAIATLVTREDTGGYDLAAFTAVLTTIGAAILAHIEAQRYGFLVTTYRAAERRLTDTLAAFTPTLSVPSPAWSDLVNRCEGIISAENNSWVAKWSAK